jgi:CRP-like cAMP-binding protein
MNVVNLSSLRIQEAMSRLTYFQSWRPDQLERLSAAAELAVFPKNATLVRKGEKLDALYIVVCGQVRLFIPLQDEIERVISLADQGDSFGEACLILNELCPFEAITTRNSHIIAVNAEAYRNELRLEPSHMERALNLVSKRLVSTLRDMEIYSQRSSLRRVACFLMQYKPEPDSRTYQIQLPARKRDIAAKLGLSQETFSRVLSFLGRQGVIQVNGGLISVEDGQELAMLSPTGCPNEAQATSS